MDLLITETFNGGDLIKKPKDLLTIEGFENMPYLAMFGGNLQADTPTLRLASEQAFDWWGNALLMGADQGLQFNSKTERILNQVSLTSNNRALIQQAVQDDLAFMRDFARVGVSVSILGTDRVLIAIRIIRPDNLEQRDFIYIWDSTLNELTVPYQPGSGQPVLNEGFNYTLNFTFS